MAQFMISNEMAHFFNAHDAQAAMTPLFFPIIVSKRIDEAEQVDAVGASVGQEFFWPFIGSFLDSAIVPSFQIKIWRHRIVALLPLGHHACHAPFGINQVAQDIGDGPFGFFMVNGRFPLAIFQLFKKQNQRLPFVIELFHDLQLLVYHFCSFLSCG